MESTHSFLKTAEALGLIESSLRCQLETEHSADIDSGDVRSLATSLVQRDVLTKFQADAILAGELDTITFGEYLVLGPLGKGTV